MSWLNIALTSRGLVSFPQLIGNDSGCHTTYSYMNKNETISEWNLIEEGSKYFKLIKYFKHLKKVIVNILLYIGYTWTFR